MIVMIDNYDSFTYNLVQLLAMAGARVEVLRNDAESVEDVVARRPRGIVISPGPGRPERAGISQALFEARPEVPILGVCLGHQALGQAFGARVDRADHLTHGKASAVRHRGEGLFEGLPETFQAGRYHSLEVREATLPDELLPQAWTVEGKALMAVRHRDLPYWGVQFHPESVLTDAGAALAENFLRLCGETDGDRKEKAP